MKKNEPYIRIRENAKIAVLMVHGIAGTPAQFEALIPLIPEDYSIYNILLDGHGKTVLDFGKASMKKWKAQFRKTLEDLRRQYDGIFIVAHSMGTLFSIQHAVENPDKILRLFLLSVPTRPFPRVSTVRASYAIMLGRVKKGDKIAHALIKGTSIQLEKGIFPYITWIPRLIELLFECRKTRKMLPKLAIPSDTFQSQADELVSARSIKDLNTHPYIKNTVLFHSGHLLYGDEDLVLLKRYMEEAVKEIQKTQTQ
ncbi:MAG: alpha/beta hydrolase [Clostridia bacterium]|nr:alpha/beta hydrolase [Clostridia bacterium]